MKLQRLAIITMLIGGLLSPPRPAIASSQLGRESARVPASTASPTGASLSIPGAGGASFDLGLNGSSPEQRRELSAQNMRAKHAAAIEAMRINCAKRPGIIRETITEYPSDWAAQMAGFSLAVEDELSMDPQWAESFVENSVTDPYAHAAMIMFTMTNNLTERAFRFVGMSYDQCTLLKRSLDRAAERGRPGKGGQLALRVKPTKGQKMFAPFARGFAMTAGAGVSSVVGEFLRDADVKTCAKHVVGKQVEKGAEACDKMHEEWFVKGRISKFTPTLLSTFIATAMIGLPPLLATSLYEKAKATRSNKTSRAVLKGMVKSFKIVKRATLLIPGPQWMVGFAMEFGHEMMFWAFSKSLEPTIQQSYAKYVSRKNILEGIWRLNVDIDDLQRLKWDPPANWASIACTPGQADNPYENDPLKGPIFMPQSSPLCSWDTIDMNIRELGYFYSIWRDAALQGFKQSHKSWQDYTAGFIKVYGYSHDFYRDIAHQLSAYKKGDSPNLLNINHFTEAYLDNPDAISMAKTLGLRYSFCAIKDAFKGEVVGSVNGKSGVGRKIGVMQIDLFDEIIKIARRERDSASSSLPPWEVMSDRDALDTIISGFESLDCSKSLKGFQKGVMLELSAPVSADADAAVKVQDAKLRFALFGNALRALDLKTRPLQLENLNAYEMSKGRGTINRAFLHIKAMLPPELTWVPGAPFVAQLADALSLPKKPEADDAKPKAADPEKTKPLHPNSIGNARTDNMTDYLLTSMVCGAEVDYSLQEKVAILRADRKGKTARYSLDSVPDAQLTKLAEEHFEKKITPEPAWLESQAGRPGMSLLREQFAWPMHFHPPRIIAKEIKENLCGSNAADGFLPGLRFDVHRKTFKIAGQTRVGVIDVISHHLRPEVLSPTGDATAFENWWNKNVYPLAYKRVALLRTDYEQLIQSKFYTALAETGNERLKLVTMPVGIVRSVQDQFTKHLRLISSTIPSWQENQEVRVSFERHHAAILKDINYIARALTDLENGRAVIEEIEDIYVPSDSDRQVLEERRQLAKSRSGDSLELKMIHEVRYAQALQWIRDDIDKQLQEFENLSTGSTTKNAGEKDPLNVRVRKALVNNLKGVNAEIGNYVQYMAALQARSGL